jgi:hypothetical protein
MRKAFLFPFAAEPVGSIPMAGLRDWGFDGVGLIAWPAQGPDYTAFRKLAAEAKANGLEVMAAWHPWGNDAWFRCWPDEWLQSVPHIMVEGQFIAALWEQPEAVYEAIHEWAMTCQQLGVSALRLPFGMWGEPSIYKAFLPVGFDEIGYTTEKYLAYMDHVMYLCREVQGRRLYTMGCPADANGYDDDLFAKGIVQAAEADCMLGWFGMAPNPDPGVWSGTNRRYVHCLQFGFDLAVRMKLGIHFEEQCPPPQEAGPDTFAEFQGCLGRAKSLAAGGDCCYVHRRDCMDRIKAMLAAMAKPWYKQVLDAWRAP